MSGQHARPGQRRDAIATWIRDTWTLARRWLRSALAWYLAAGDWRKLPADARALNAGRPVDYWPAYYPGPLIARRVPVAAGGAPGPAPVAGAPEVPVPACPPGGPGTSPDHLWPGDPATAPAESRRTSREGETRTTASRQGTPQLRYADPEAPAAPATPGAARPPWVITQAPPGTPMRQAGRGAPGRRETIAMPALEPVRPYYLAHLARQDAVLDVPQWATGPETLRLLRAALGAAS